MILNTSNVFMNKNIEFTKPENIKNQFIIKRPSFIAGTVNKQKSSDISHDKFLKLNERKGIGNKEIIRPAFVNQNPRPRMTLEFDKLQLLSADEAGQVIKQNDTKLNYKTRVHIPDDTDFEWINEKNRLSAIYRAQFTNSGYPVDMIQPLINKELDINKPLGREQRKVVVITDDVAHINNLDTKNKLNEIIQEVKDGRGENQVEKQQITAQLAEILDDTKEIDRLTTLQLTDLGNSLARIGFPTTSKRLGLIPRFVDVNFYNNNAGMINLLIFSRVREEPNSNAFNYDRCVKNFAINPLNGLPASKLTSAVSALGLKSDNRNKRYLDLELCGIISVTQLKNHLAAYYDGYNNSDFSIDPINRPP